MTPREPLAPPLPAAMPDDVARITAAVSRAQRAAVERHRRLGEPVVVCRDDHVVEEVPAELPGSGSR